MKNRILSTVLIFITTLTISLAQSKKPYNIVINEEVFVRPEDRDLSRVQEAQKSISDNMKPIFNDIMENCPEFNIIDKQITNDLNFVYDDINEGRLQDSKLGLQQEDISTDILVLSYISYERRADQNSLSLKLVLADKDFILKTVENDFFKLSLFTPNDNKGAKERNKVIEKMLRELLDFKKLKTKEGFNKITKKCTCSHTKVQRFFRENFIRGGSSIGVGLLATAYGTSRVVKANQEYTDYEYHDYVEDPFYTNMGTTRNDFLKKDIRKKNRIGYTSLGAGLALTAVGVFGVKIYFDCKEGKSPGYSDATMQKKSPQKSLSISPLLDYDPVTARLNSQIRISYQF